MVRRTFLIISFLLTALPAAAQISPGKLSRYHVTLEGIGNCTRCHVLGQEVANAKCLDCHTPIQARQTAGTGYHGRGPAKSQPCRECHSEHNGREFELVHWPGGKTAFDHSPTGFALEGAHRIAECARCHQSAFIADPEVTAGRGVNPARTFLGLGRECVNCHEDEHGERLADNCRSCHSTDAWKPAPGFSHAQTDYPLTGKHQNVTCAQCHPLDVVAAAAGGKLRKKENRGFRARYDGLEFASCTPCHRDPHAGRFGGACADCHTTAGFGQIAGGKFNHDRTDYPLTGGHTQVACAKCHTSGGMTTPVAHAACRDCHRDGHGGQFADRKDSGACESCHSTSGFTPARYGIDEHAQSRYPLTGSHLAVPCSQCHAITPEQPRGRFDFADTRCQGCHKDAHQGQLDLWITRNGCEFCHNADTWHRTVFDHKLARFPLEGKHREILCLKCHTVKHAETGTEQVWMKPLSMECASCHTDIHGGQFVLTEQHETAADCRRCHTPAGWKELTFDHNRDSRFALDGAHSRVACTACHRPADGAAGVLRVVYKPLPVECAGCHSGNIPKL